MPADPTTRFRQRQVEVDAKCFYGTAESGKDIVAWVRRHGGQVSWMPAGPPSPKGPGMHGYVVVDRPGGTLNVDTSGGQVLVAPGQWVVLAERAWSVLDDEYFASRYVAAPDVPHQMVADWDTGKLTVDGEEFPYPVSADLPVEISGAGPLTIVSIPVLVESFVCIGKAPGQ